MNEAKKRKGRKPKKVKPTKTRVPADHKRDFEQLLDDAIFGVRKKTS